MPPTRPTSSQRDTWTRLEVAPSPHRSLNPHGTDYRSCSSNPKEGRRRISRTTQVCQLPKVTWPHLRNSLSQSKWQAVIGLGPHVDFLMMFSFSPPSLTMELDARPKISSERFTTKGQDQRGEGPSRFLLAGEPLSSHIFLHFVLLLTSFQAGN